MITSFQSLKSITRKRSAHSLRATAIGTCVAVLAATSVVATPAQAVDPLPLADPTTTVDTYVGQSIQVRQDAEGNPNSNLLDFRWAATQVNAEADAPHNASVPIPMAEAPMLRSLIGSSASPDQVENGVEYNFNELTGVEVFRTLNLWPQHKELPIDVKAEFTLNGEKVNAQDVVGKGGKLQATYTITNNTVKEQSVRYKNLAGKMATDTVKTSQPMVAIGEQLLPQTWGRFNQGSALVGADGRGNFQAQWVGLPFTPIAKDGVATFQWSADVPEGQGVIPKMLINIAPVYIPSDDMIPKVPGLPAVNPPGLGQVESGAGVALMGGKEVVAGIIELIGAIGQGRNVAAAKLPGAISDTKNAVAKLEKTLAPFADSKIPTLPQTIQRLQRISTNLTGLSADLRANGNNSQKVKDIQKDLALAGTGVEAIDLYVNAANNYTQVTQNTKNTLTQKKVDPNVCAQATTDIGGALLRAQCLLNKDLVMGTHLEVDTALNLVGDTLLATSAALPKLVGDLEADGIDDVNAALKDITSQLQDFQIFLTGTLLPQVKGVTGGAGEIFAAIQAGIDTIKKDAAPGTTDIKKGIGDIGTGIGIAGPGAKELIAWVLSLVTAGKEDLKKVVTEVNQLKAEAQGLLDRAKDSPLPYGGGLQTVYQPSDKPAVNVQEVSQAILDNNGQVPDKYKAYVQPTNHVFGAYQFMMDPANSNQSDTLPMAIIGIVLLALAGIGFPLILKRRKKNA